MARGIDCEPTWTTVHNAHLQERVVCAEEGPLTVVGHVIQIEDFHFVVLAEDNPGETAFRFDEAKVSFVPAPEQKSEAQR